MTKWPVVPLGDVLELRREAIDPEPGTGYISVGIKSFGNGLFRYPEVPGAELSKIRYFRMPGRCLLASNIQAWEGALAVASYEDAELCIASNRFLPYVPYEEARVDLDFVFAYFMSDRGREALRAASPGTAVRNKTLSRKLFEATGIPLPPLDEQRRIAQRVASVDGGVRELGSAAGDAAVAVDSAVEQFIAQLPEHGWTWRRIDQVAEVNPRRAKLADDDHVAFVPMSAVDDFTGSILRPEVRTAVAVSGGYTQFLPGDIIFARITPCMQNGKSALFLPTADVRAGYGSTEFHVLRPTGIEAEWLHAWLRRRRFRLQATEAFTGTAGQQRVPAGYLAEAEILVPPTPEAQTNAIARMRDFERLRQSFVSRQRTRRALQTAIQPAMLNEVFSGRL